MPGNPRYPRSFHTPCYGAEVTAGVTNWAVLDLATGPYVAICFVLSPNHDGAPHFTLGMIQPLTVT